MGVDIYINWEGKTDEEQETQYTGKVGYLRGAYFGGYSDVLRQLFTFMDWDEESLFDEIAQLNYERNLEELESRWIAPEYLIECRAFLNFGKQLWDEGKKPTIEISY